MFVCPQCGGDLIETTSIEYGVECDTCSYPYQEEE